MMYAVWSAAGPRRQWAARLGGTVARHPAIAWVGAAAAFTVVSLAIGLPMALQPFSEMQRLEARALYALVALLLLAPAVFDSGQGQIRRFLRWRPVAFMGLVSYGVYLWHKTLLDHIIDWTGGDASAIRGNFPVSVVLTLVVSLAVATVSRRYLEDPLHRRFANGGRSQS